MNDTPKAPSRRGFASMSPERRRELGSKGGKNVPNEKRHFSQNPDGASEAGKERGRLAREERKRDDKKEWPVKA